MPYINKPYINGFQWIAAQLGASEFQIAEITGIQPRAIKEDLRDIGQLLAFPYHDRRGGAGLSQTQVTELWRRWKQAFSWMEATPQMTLHSFRALTDPWMQVDTGLLDPAITRHPPADNRG